MPKFIPFILPLTKVDSETYPVAESISETWYYGEGNKAGTERWAFAISAKKDWKSKVQSDIRKIVSVNRTDNRGYTKIFFMSNQYVSDKKRADTEDALRKELNIDVRILDRSWLLERVFASSKNKEIAIECFSLSDNFRDEVNIGTNDYRRNQELKEIETRLKCSDIKASEYVILARRSVVLARELEFSINKMQGLLNRYEKLAYEYGSELDVANSIYDAAWTIYWWYSDYDSYYNYYKKYETITLAKDNVYLFSNLIALWINLYSISVETKLDITEHANLISGKYKYLISDPTKPNTAIEAKASYQLVRFFLGDNIDDIVNELITILKDSPGHLDLDLCPLNRVIQEFPLLRKSERYNELFELGVSILSQQEKESTAALMLAKRGRSLKAEKPYEALSYFSRALTSFYNEQNKEYLIAIVIEMAEIFQETGLVWAARNFYYYDFCLCLNQYLKFGEIYPALFISVHALKYVELRLGRIIYSTEFDLLEKIARKIYPGNINDSEEDHIYYDQILAVQILRTPYEMIDQLEKLPKYLEQRSLHFSCAAIKYELGYYDEAILSAYNGDKAAFDDLIEKWNSHPIIDKLINKPWYGNELPYVLKTNVLGCSLELCCLYSMEHGEAEVAATLLATIESFFGTGVLNKLFSLAGKIKLYLRYDSNTNPVIKGNILVDRPNEINITFRDYEKDSIIKDQETFADFLIELVSMVTCIMFPFESEMKKIEKMIINDAAFARSHTFSNSVFYGLDTLGKSTFSFNSVISGFDSLPIIKKDPPNAINSSHQVTSENTHTPEVVYFSKPPEGLGFETVSHENIKTSSIINVSLWNISEWKGVYLGHSIPPIFAPVYAKPACKAIFEEWITDIGNLDNDDIISIKIIKGIDKTNPSWYRVIIGSTKFPESTGNKPTIALQPFRLHTMTVDNSINLVRFEEALSKSGSYYICPVLLPSPTRQPEFIKELVIKKRKSSISICNAWEIEMNDFLAIWGVLPTDNPIIPEGKKDVPILEAIKRKKERVTS